MVVCSELKSAAKYSALACFLLTTHHSPPTKVMCCSNIPCTNNQLVRRKGASWSLNWPSGANSLAHLQLKCILYVPL